MMRNQFETQLAKLNQELIEMGALVERAIATSATALVNHDAEIARSVATFDNEVDQKEKDIESLCLKLLLQQQPVARDLRLISAALKMITDMERIGDQAEDIAELVILLEKQPYVKDLEHIPAMARATIKMVTDSIDAFVRRDIELARAVCDYDDVVDDLFQTIKYELIALIQSKAEHSEQAVDLLMVAKYFERIGDHAVNVAEWVIFSITGVH